MLLFVIYDADVKSYKTQFKTKTMLRLAFPSNLNQIIKFQEKLLAFVMVAISETETSKQKRNLQFYENF